MIVYYEDDIYIKTLNQKNKGFLLENHLEIAFYETNDSSEHGSQV